MQKEKERGRKKKGGGVWTGVVRKVKFGRTKEYQLISRAHFPSEDQIENIVAKVKNSNIITATELSDEFQLKVSTTMKILKMMEKEGIIKPTEFSDSNFKAYTPTKEK